MGDGEQNNPFRFLRVWTLPLFLIVPYTVVWVVYFLIGISLTGQLLSLLWIYLWVFFWIWWQFARLGISWRRLIGELPDGVSLKFCIGSAAMLFVFSSASIWLVLYPLSYLFPAFAQEQLNGALNFRIPQSDNAILFGTLVVLLFFCVAPIVEELFFRGVLLHRWKLKWGLLRAILASSAFFALAHLDVNIVGRIAVGFVMSVLYLKTRTILVPIFCHVVLNVLAMSF
jgi:membrane protease YdiL (CAAX protease family)